MQTRADKDIELLDTWKQSGDKTHLHTLLKAYNPIIQQHVSKWRASGIPDSVLEANAKRITVKAFETYDPSRGTQLNTHVINHLQKLNRLGYKYQNVAKIPEHRVIKMGTYQRTKNLLGEKFGREPNAGEMRDELHWSLKEIGRMEKEHRKDLLASQDTLQDMPSMDDSEDAELDKIHLMYHDLSGTERSVLEHSVGLFGKPKLSGNDIALKLNMTPTQVSRVRKTLADKYMQYEE